MLVIKHKRTNSVNRTNYTPEEAEFVYASDTKQIYVGDGSTPGGNIVGGGPAGPSGYSGYSGYSGFSGYSGYSGVSGYSGIGFSGESGFSGFSGIGFSGESGYSGVSGDSGWSGYSGIKGEVYTSVFVNSNYNASPQELIHADSSGGSFTIFLPSSPSQGDKLYILDSCGYFGDFPVTVDRNGEKIQGFLDNLYLNVKNANIFFVYDGTDCGWRIDIGGTNLGKYEGFSGYSGYSGYSGSKNLTIRTVSSSSVIVLFSDELLLADTSSNDITFDIISAVSYPGKNLIFKKISPTNSMILNPNGSQTIDGSLTLTSTENNSSISICSDGSNWIII